jgi:hypothetical protein
MVCIDTQTSTSPSGQLVINDHGAASLSAPSIVVNPENGTPCFVTPVTYKPLGPVSVLNESTDFSAYVVARMW